MIMSEVFLEVNESESGNHVLTGLLIRTDIST